MTVEGDVRGPEYRVRPAAMRDVEFLTDVAMEAMKAKGALPDDFDDAEWRRGFADWTEEQVRGEIPFSTTSVIEAGHESVGRLRVVRDGERIELAGMQLRPHTQGRGIGTAVIEALKVEAAESGVPLELSVELDNPRARALYERLGFIRIGQTKREEQYRWQPPPV